MARRSRGIFSRRNKGYLITVSLVVLAIVVATAADALFGWGPAGIAGRLQQLKAGSTARAA